MTSTECTCRRRWLVGGPSSSWPAVAGRPSFLPWAWAFGPESPSSSQLRLVAAATERPWLL